MCRNSLCFRLLLVLSFFSASGFNGSRHGRFSLGFVNAGGWGFGPALLLSAALPIGPGSELALGLRDRHARVGARDVLGRGHIVVAAVLTVVASAEVWRWTGPMSRSS